MKATRRRLLALTASSVFFIYLGATGTANAADLKVLTGFGIRPVLEELGPQFERSAGHKLILEYHSSGPMKRAIDSGTPFDVAIVTQAIGNELVKQAKIQTPTVVARAGVGIAVKPGARKPPLESADALKSALLNAKSIAYAGEGATAAHLVRILDRLGISAELKPRLRPQKSAEAVSQAVADGNAELGFSVISSIREFRGVELAGALPKEQEYVVYSAAVGSAAKNTEGARVFVKFLSDPSAVPTLRAKGMEPGGQ